MDNAAEKIVPDADPADQLENPLGGGFPLEEESDENKADMLGFEEPDESSILDLDPFLIELMQKEPFWSLISRRVSKRRTRQLPTAGVTVRKSEFVLLWNDLFMSKMSFDEKIGILKHEFSHLVLEHVTNRRRDKHVLWNIATDLAINSLISEQQIADGLLLPGRALKIDPSVYKKLTPEQKLSQQALSKLIEAMPKEQASDWYYDRLIQSGVAQQLEESGATGECIGQFDDHEGWDAVPESERELLRGKLKQILEQAVRESDAKNMWGNVPASMREYLRRLISREIDWRAVLRTFVGYCKSPTRTTTLRKINRRFPYIHPGVKRGHQARILIEIDQSGSVDDDSLGKVFAELSGLSKLIEFTVMHFDSTVDEESKYKWRRGQNIMPRRTRCGGTDFNAPTRYVNEHASEYDGLIICTDGECSKPDPCLVRRGWVIVPGRKLLFDCNEIVIQMTKESD